MTRFCLVRHGQTDWNIEGRYQGQSDVPLNTTGRVQATTLTLKLTGQSFSAIYSSDLKRAKETAEIVAAMLNLPVSVDTRLREINQGDWEGQLAKDIQSQFTELWQEWKETPARIRPPNGESVDEVAHRIYAVLDEISIRYPSGLVLIVSHGLAIATVLCKQQNLKIEQAYKIIPNNAEPNWVNWNE